MSPVILELVDMDIKRPEDRPVRPVALSGVVVFVRCGVRIGSLVLIERTALPTGGLRLVVELAPLVQALVELVLLFLLLLEFFLPFFKLV
jgi:hypothetical protein